MEYSIFRTICFSFFWNTNYRESDREKYKFHKIFFCEILHACLKVFVFVRSFCSFVCLCIVSTPFFVLVDGGFGSWSSFKDCSEECGEGYQERTRQCNKPAPAHGGEDCLGETTDSRVCKLKECPGKRFVRFLEFLCSKIHVEKSVFESFLEISFLHMCVGSPFGFASENLYVLF